MSSRSLEDLRPSTRTKARSFIALCETDLWLNQNNVTVLVICTWRSAEEQTELYAKGRTTPGRIVTNAKAGQSAHNDFKNGRRWARAFDVVPLRSGKPVWGVGGNGIDDNAGDDATDDLEIWQRVGAAGKSTGLEWAGDWKTFKEFPHFQEAL